MKNYGFPELACYSKEWVPVLEAAKLALDQEDFLCPAVTAAARVCETQYGGTAWQELGFKIKTAISNSLGRHTTVTNWHTHTFGKSITRHERCRKKVKDYKAYRLAWIDHIIKECEECPNP